MSFTLQEAQAVLGGGLFGGGGSSSQSSSTPAVIPEAQSINSQYLQQAIQTYNTLQSNYAQMMAGLGQNYAGLREGVLSGISGVYDRQRDQINRQYAATTGAARARQAQGGFASLTDSYNLAAERQRQDQEAFLAREEAGLGAGYTSQLGGQQLAAQQQGMNTLAQLGSGLGNLIGSYRAPTGQQSVSTSFGGGGGGGFGGGRLGAPTGSWNPSIGGIGATGYGRGGGFGIDPELFGGPISTPMSGGFGLYESRSPYMVPSYSNQSVSIPGPDGTGWGGLSQGNIW